MKRQTALVGTALCAIVGSTSLAFGQAAPAPAAPSATAPTGPAAAPKPAQTEEEGPFAPKGRTGKLRENDELDRAEAKSEPERSEPPEAKKKGRADLDFVWGFGKLEKPGSGAAADSVASASFVLGGSYEVMPGFVIGLRVPLSTGSVTAPEGSPARDSFNTTAFGNVTLRGRYELSLSQRARMPIDLAIALPTASGDFFADTSEESGRSSVRRYQINQIAAASRGYEENALFIPHRLGVVPGVGIDYRRGLLKLEGYTRLPLLIRAGGQSVPTFPEDPRSGLKSNSLEVEWVTGGQALYSILPGKLDAGVRAWFVYFIKDAIEVPASAGSEGPSKTQFVLEPTLLAKFDSVRAGFGFLWPIGGRIGADPQINGLRLTAAYLF